MELGTKGKHSERFSFTCLILLEKERPPSHASAAEPLLGDLEGRQPWTGDGLRLAPRIHWPEEQEGQAAPGLGFLSIQLGQKQTPSQQAHGPAWKC